MVEIRVVSRAGIERCIDAAEGSSVMEAMRDGGVDDLLAICGGCCSCATCHIYVDPRDFDRLPALSEDENDLLESCDYRTACSRLACQVHVEQALHGLRIELAPEE